MFDCILIFSALFQIEYNELEAFNGDSSSVVVETESFAIDKLQPGRNYSIAIKAVSNGMESVERRFYQATSKFQQSSDTSMIVNDGIGQEFVENCSVLLEKDL